MLHGLLIFRFSSLKQNAALPERANWQLSSVGEREKSEWEQEIGKSASCAYTILTSTRTASTSERASERRRTLYQTYLENISFYYRPEPLLAWEERSSNIQDLSSCWLTIQPCNFENATNLFLDLVLNKFLMALQQYLGILFKWTFYSKLLDICTGKFLYTIYLFNTTYMLTYALLAYGSYLNSLSY